ncbi:MAG: hypothetical protein IJB45_06185, partial [Clostridia bacterium]|nr:hypothetical protein [Clostridia bacterium]
NKKIQLEAAVIKMCGPSVSGNASVSSEIEERIARLEEMLASGAAPAQPAKAPAPAAAPIANNPAPAAKEKTEEEKPPVPQAPPPAEEPAPAIADGNFSGWSDVLEKLQKYDIPLFGILAGSSASVKNGRIVINSDNPTLYDFICTDTHYKELAKAVYETVGQKMKIAVATAEKPKASSSPLEELKNKINKFNNN